MAEREIIANAFCFYPRCHWSLHFHANNPMQKYEKTTNQQISEPKSIECNNKRPCGIYEDYMPRIIVLSVADNHIISIA